MNRSKDERSFRPVMNLREALSFIMLMHADREVFMLKDTTLNEKVFDIGADTTDFFPINCNEHDAISIAEFLYDNKSSDPSPSICPVWLFRPLASYVTKKLPGFIRYVIVCSDECEQLLQYNVFMYVLE